MHLLVLWVVSIADRVCVCTCQLQFHNNSVLLKDWFASFPPTSFTTVKLILNFFAPILSSLPSTPRPWLPGLPLVMPLQSLLQRTISSLSRCFWKLDAFWERFSFHSPLSSSILHLGRVPWHLLIISTWLYFHWSMRKPILKRVTYMLFLFIVKGFWKGGL